VTSTSSAGTATPITGTVGKGQQRALAAKLKSQSAMEPDSPRTAAERKRRAAEKQAEYDQRRAEIYEINHIRREQNDAKFKMFMLERARNAPSGAQDQESSEDDGDDGDDRES